MTPFRRPFIAPLALRPFLRFTTVAICAVSFALTAVPQAGNAAPIDAEGLARQGRIDEALAAAAEQAQQLPGDMEIQELYIDLLLNTGMAAQAEQRFTQRVQSNPLDADSHYLLGRATIDAREARTAYERALKLKPDHARAHMGIAAVHTALGAIADADIAYARATAMDPSLIEAWVGLVRSRVAAADMAGAKVIVQQGLAANPHEPQLTYTLVTLDPTTAATVLPAAMKATPSDAPLRSAWASHLLATGASEEALAAARGALALDPSSAEAARVAFVADELVQGRLTRESATQLESARRIGDVAALDAVVAVAPRSVLALLARASAHANAGAPERARADLERAYALDATHPEACAAVGQARLSAGKAADALAPLQCAAEVRAFDVALQVALARAEAASGSTASALQRLESLATSRPYDVIILGVYAQVLVDTGQADKAYNLVKRSMARIPDPRLGAAFVMVAVASDHANEAADFLDALAAQSGSEALKQRAAVLRAGKP